MQIPVRVTRNVNQYRRSMATLLVDDNEANRALIASGALKIVQAEAPEVEEEPAPYTPDPEPADEDVED